jgi:hypothetical protein
MPHMHRPVLLLAIPVLIAACERRQPPDPSSMVQKALSGILVYPHSSPVSMSAGEDAGQLTMTTGDSLARVATWYRQYLAINGWTLQSDVSAGDSVAIVAMKGQQPVWLKLRANVGAPGTTYTLIGAVAARDSSTP